jgi:hypothetical protein
LDSTFEPAINCGLFAMKVGRKGQEVRSWAADHGSRRVAWSGDGQRFLTCGEGGKVLPWDLSEREPTRSFDG